MLANTKAGQWGQFRTLLGFMTLDPSAIACLAPGLPLADFIHLLSSGDSVASAA